MNGHDKRLTTAATILGLLLFGCTGGDWGFGEDYRGAAAFDSQTSSKLFLARPEGYMIRRFASPWEQAEPLFDSDEPLYGSFEAPGLYPEPNGSRILVDKISFAFGTGPALYEVTQNGATDVGLDGTVLDVHWGPTLPWVFHQASDFTLRFTRGPSNPGGAWATVAGTTDSNCVAAGSAIVVENGDNPVGFCGGKILTLGSGADLVVNTSGSIAFSVAADGVRGADGNATFFFLAAGEGATTRLHRMRRDGLAPSGWSSQELTTMAGAPYEGSHSIVAASETSVAIVANRCETDEFGTQTCTGDLYAMWFDGNAWQVEIVATLGDNDALEGVTAVAGANEPPRIMTGSIKLYMHTRGGTTWTSEHLGALGVQVDGGGCEIGSDLAPTALRVTLALLLLGPAVLLLRRRD